MIDGVVVLEATRHSDDRGFFSEIAKEERDIGRIGQVSLAKVYPGVIKAFHFHRQQADLWYVVAGNIQAVMHDLRETSPTFKKTQTIFLGEDNPRMVVIPAGVAHGYKVLGAEAATILYVVSTSYNPDNPDELRLPFDDPGIGYDWSTKNR